PIPLGDPEGAPGTAAVPPARSGTAWAAHPLHRPPPPPPAGAFPRSRRPSHPPLRPAVPLAGYGRAAVPAPVPATRARRPAGRRWVGRFHRPRDAARAVRGAGTRTRTAPGGRRRDKPRERARTGAARLRALRSLSVF